MMLDTMEIKMFEKVREEKRKLVEELVAKYVAIIEKDGHYMASTAPQDSYGWCLRHHNAMPEVCDELNKLGVKTRHSISFRVHDWYMTI
jgi:hypothetical protein